MRVLDKCPTKGAVISHFENNETNSCSDNKNKLVIKAESIDNFVKFNSEPRTNDIELNLTMSKIRDRLLLRNLYVEVETNTQKNVSIVRVYAKGQTSYIRRIERDTLTECFDEVQRLYLRG